MTFAIRLPRESIVSVQTLVSWITAHLSPSIPVQKCSITENNLNEIYGEFAQEIDTQLSYEQFKATSFAGGRHEVTELEHKGWLQQQELELHVTVTELGVAKLALIISGPSVATTEGITFGHQQIFTFGYRAYYRGDDSFVLGLLHEEDLQTPNLIPEGTQPLSFDPVLNVDYRASKEDNRTHEQIAEDFVMAIGSMLDQQGFGGDDALTTKLYGNVRDFFKNSWDFSGSFHEPLYAQLYGNVVPNPEGRKLFLTVTTSYGKQYRLVLPVIQLP